MAASPRDGPITGSTTVREAVARYPGIEAIFEKHGIMGCGGPNGPVEPIAFFARVHGVEPDALLGELNDFALHGSMPAAAAAAEPAARGRRDFYPVPIASSLLLAMLGGFPLGALVAFGAVHDIGLNGRWMPLVQAHGHLQIMGWVGLFIMGVAYHALPRFKGTSLRFSRLVWPSFLLLLGGVTLRTVSQPWVDAPWVSGLLVSSAALELAGAAAFSIVVTATVSAGRQEAYEAFLVAGVFWLSAAAAANLAVLAELAATGDSVVAQDRNAPLLEMQLYGFITLFVFGISQRVLPAFLNLRPPRASAFTPALLLFNAGLVLRVGTGWAQAYADWHPLDSVESLAAYLLTGAVLALILALNVHLPSVPGAIADPERGYAKLIRAAYLWLAVAVGLETWLATRALIDGSAAAWLEAGGVRHALALGFITQMIFGVGSRVLPVFAGKRLYSQRLLDATFVLINAAAVVRVVPAVLEMGSATSRFDHIGAAGILGLLAVALFGYNIARTAAGPAAVAPVDKTAARAKGEPRREKFVVTKYTVVAEVLEHVPGALDLLISYGFAPLRDPAIRKMVTPNVTLETGSRVHAIDLDALLRDLNRLAEGSPGQSAGRASDEAFPPSQPSAARLDAGRVLAALRQCHDPEIPINIVDLGLVYDITLDEGSVGVIMTLTSPDCPLADDVVGQVEDAVKQLGAHEVKVRLVRDPPWNPSRMSPAARAALGWE